MQAFAGLAHFLRSLPDILHEQGRNDVYRLLLKHGAIANMVERGDARERDDSLGLIALEGEAVQWVDVARESSGDFDSYLAHYCVPDARLLGEQAGELTITLESAKSGLWSGNDLGLGIIDKLNSDPRLCLDLATMHPTLITADKHGYWDIQGLIDDTSWFRPWKTFDPPVAQRWKAYCRIGRYLVSGSSNTPDKQ